MNLKTIQQMGEMLDIMVLPHKPLLLHPPQLIHALQRTRTPHLDQSRLASEGRREDQSGGSVSNTASIRTLMRVKVKIVGRDLLAEIETEIGTEIGVVTETETETETETGEGVTTGGSARETEAEAEAAAAVVSTRGRERGEDRLGPRTKIETPGASNKIALITRFLKKKSRKIHLSTNNFLHSAAGCRVI